MCVCLFANCAHNTWDVWLVSLSYSNTNTPSLQMFFLRGYNYTLWKCLFDEVHDKKLTKRTSLPPFSIISSDQPVKNASLPRRRHRTTAPYPIEVLFSLLARNDMRLPVARLTRVLSIKEIQKHSLRSKQIPAHVPLDKLCPYTVEVETERVNGWVFSRLCRKHFPFTCSCAIRARAAHAHTLRFRFHSVSNRRAQIRDTQKKIKKNQTICHPYLCVSAHRTTVGFFYSTVRTIAEM